MCVRVRACGMRSDRMYNLYQIHLAVVVVICHKFIRKWFDELTQQKIYSLICFYIEAIEKQKKTKSDIMIWRERE